MSVGRPYAELFVGTAETVPETRYLTGFSATDPVLVIRIGRSVHLVVPEMELGRAQHAVHGHNVTVHTASSLGLSRAQRRRRTASIEAVLRLCKTQTVKVPPMFPHALAMAIKQRGIRVLVAEDVQLPERTIKQPVELSHLREAQRAAVFAMQRAVKTIAAASIGHRKELRLNGKALCAENVQECIHHALIEHRAFCQDVIVAGGKQSADPHERGHGPLRAGEPIVIDIFPRHVDHGYWGDLTRTVVRGEAPSELRKMYVAVKAAQKAALAKVKPGVQCKTVHEAAVAEMVRRGFDTHITKERREGFIHSTGHGVGLAVHELPMIAPVSTRLRKNQVCTIEPGLYYRHIGGIRIEDTVVVTSNGWRYLAPCERWFEI